MFGKSKPHRLESYLRISVAIHFNARIENIVQEQDRCRYVGEYRVDDANSSPGFRG